MNYLWELLLKAQEQGVDVKTLRFVPAKVYSPYMELSQIDINNQDIREGQEIEVNPYYRFYPIFKDMFLPDLHECEDLRRSLFHLILHFIAENDRLQGMNRNEYYMKFLYEDIKNGTYGDQIKTLFELFSKKEKRILLNRILKLYFCGDSLELLKDVIRTLFAKVVIYNSNEDPYELVIFIGAIRTDLLEQKIRLVLQLFANIKYNVEVYYEYHFAILEVDDTSVMDEIALY